MSPRRFGTFSGGIDLPAEKDATLKAAIVPWQGQELKVPLSPLPAPAARPIVSAGERVHQGDLLAQADDPRQINVYAPLAGAVGEVTDVLLPDDFFSWRPSRAILLKDVSDSDESASRAGGSEPVNPDPFDWQKADQAALLRRLREGQLMICGGQSGPLSEFLDRALLANVTTLIANVMENMPMVTADHRLLAECGGEVVAGLAILAKALGAKETILAVDSRRTGAYKLAARHCRSHRIQTIALTPKYPIGAEAILVKVLARRQVAPGADSLSVRVGVVDAATCGAVYQWVALGRRQLGRVVTISGLGVNRPANCLAPFGADATSLLRQATDTEPVLAVHGSPMNGRQLAAGAVVGPTTNALLGMADSYAGPSTPCIRCSWCSDSCPARLNVAALNDDFELANLDGAKARQVTACVGCGICSYVCPARLPLMFRCQQLKRLIVQESLRATRLACTAGIGSDIGSEAGLPTRLGSGSGDPPPSRIDMGDRRP